MIYVALLTYITHILATLSASNFQIASYTLPDDQARRHTTTILSDNTLYLVGGLNRYGPSNPDFEAIRNVYSLNPTDTTPQWSFVSDISETVMAQPWFTTTRGMLSINNNLYLACHDNRDGQIYSFNPTNGEFTSISVSPYDFTEDCCAVGITVNNDDRIYITGGIMATNNNPSSAVIYYSITKNEWFEVASLNNARSHHACTQVISSDENQMIYVLGGVNRTTLDIFASIEAYDISDNQWTQYDNVLSPARRSAGAIPIWYGDSDSEDAQSIVLLGGDTRSPGHPLGGAPLNNVEILNIETNTMMSSADVPQLNFARASPGSTLGVFDDCYKIFVVAGQGSDGNVRADTETWDFRCGDLVSQDSDSGSGSGSGSDEFSFADLLFEENDISEDRKEHTTMQITLSTGALMNIYAIFVVVLLANVGIWYCCYKTV